MKASPIVPMAMKINLGEFLASIETGSFAHKAADGDDIIVPAIKTNERHAAILMIFTFSF
jgi:hypothetical protein